MATLADLLATARIRLDDTVEPYHWSDEILTAHANDAVRQAVIRKRLILDRRTEETCSYPVAADTATVTLHSAVLAIRSARWSDSTDPLALTTLKRMDNMQPDWPSRPAGIPTCLIVDANTGAVDLWPTPAAAGTLTLAVWRAPLDAETMEGPEDEPVIDELFQPDLVDWIEHLAFLSPEGEQGDLQRSDRAAQRFTAKFGNLPDAHAMKLWALGRGRGQTAQFL